MPAMWWLPVEASRGLTANIGVDKRRPGAAFFQTADSGWLARSFGLALRAARRLLNHER